MSSCLVVVVVIVAVSCACEAGIYLAPSKKFDARPTCSIVLQIYILGNVDKDIEFSRQLFAVASTSQRDR